MPTVVEYLNLYAIAPPVLPELPGPCFDAAVGGIKRAYVCQRSRCGRLWQYDETQKLQYGVITGNTKVDTFRRVPVRRQGCYFTQSEERTPARSYNVSLTFSSVGLRYEYRDAWEILSVVRDAVFAVCDYNDRWWLIGETNGCETGVWESGTDDVRGVSGDKLTFSCRERAPVRQLSQAFVDAYVEPLPVSGSVCADDWTGVCDYDWNSFCQLAW